MASMLYSPALNSSTSLSQVIFSPLLSGSLLLAVTYTPHLVRNVIFNLVSRVPRLQISTQTWDLSAPTTVLSVLLALSVLRQLNRVLSAMAANSWRFTASKGWDWPNEIAVVTGGSSGIGKSTAEELAFLGTRIAILDVQDLPESLKKNPRIHFFQCDVTSSESVAAAANAIRQELGHPTILINNAGITRPSPILEMPESSLWKVFAVNCISLWLTTQQFLPHMIRTNKGHVVTVASIASFVALPMGADYSASKAGALAFHESLTCELKHCYKATNVVTTVVHPNFVRTPLIEGFAGHLERSGVRMLTSDQVAQPIVAQLKSRRGGQLIIPRSASPISGIRGWPVWLQELLRDVLGRQSVGM